MKVRYIAVVIFIINLLKAQVAAPQLRCLSVGASGDVTLTWIPPADPGAQFFSYEICHSISQLGAYTIIGTVTSISTTTFNHATTGANTQSQYYYVRTKFGAGGTNTSPSSDTLKSIFLNFNNPGDGVAHLSYNNLHQPPLASTSVSFSINREYPTATWVNLLNSGKLSYNDTITICTPQTYNYQISIGDGSGCISNSNIQGGILEDKNGPSHTPPIDSISVLPNGQTVIGYPPSLTSDCVGYNIYQVINSINTPMDVNQGQFNTLYTFTSTAALNGPVEFLTAPIDSCDKPGILNLPHKTIYLDHTYDKCNYQTQLSWSAYKGWPVLEYHVYYSVNGGPFQKLGKTTNTFYTHTGVDPDKNVTYYVRAFKGDGVTSSSNRITFYSYQTIAPDFIYISSVSVKNDEEINIKFIVDALKMGNGFDLYRSDDGSSFKKIAFIPFTGGPNYFYTDIDLSTREKSYYYKALAKDSCGNDRTQSSVVKSVWLQVSDVKGNMFEKHLTWNNYTAFGGGLGGYTIYRIVNDVVPSSPTGYTNGMDNQYIDNVESEAEEGSKIEYLVVAIEALGNPNNIAETANSNRATTYVEADVFVPSAFAPHGVNKVWKPVTHFVDKSDYNLKIYNRWGNLLFNTNDHTQGWDGAGATNDTYVYFITYKNSRGEYVEIKGTFTLL